MIDVNYNVGKYFKIMQEVSLVWYALSMIYLDTPCICYFYICRKLNSIQQELTESHVSLYQTLVELKVVFVILKNMLSFGGKKLWAFRKNCQLYKGFLFLNRFQWKMKIWPQCWKLLRDPQQFFQKTWNLESWSLQLSIYMEIR